MQLAQKKAYKGIGMEGWLARWYARNTGKDRKLYHQAAQRVANLLPGGGTVLEVAPGPGYMSIELARLGPYQVTGLDISHSFVQMATENAMHEGVEVAFREGNASAMPFDSESFDVVYCRAAFKNFSAPVEAIREMHRVLKPGGRTVIVDLRKDAPADAIDATVREMKLSRVNTVITNWTFRQMLLKRAYSQDDFRRMVAETPFQTCELQSDLISLEVMLRK